MTELVGAWRLVSYVDLDENERPSEGPLGSRPTGLLIYESGGRMSVSMMRDITEERPDRPGAETFMGYAGTWHLDGSSVLHHVAVSAHPHQVDTEQVRHFEHDGDRLVLRGSAVIAGRTQWRQLTWQRI